MFNKTVIHQQNDRLVPYEKTVTEHKAPTDDSIRLLNEFQEEARKNLIRQIPLKNNIIKGDISVFDCKIDNVKLISIRFAVNGEEIIIEDKITDDINMNPDAAAEKIINMISKTIAQKLTINIKE
jgi:hypothetical protein